MIPVHYEDYTWIQDGLALAAVDAEACEWAASPVLNPVLLPEDIAFRKAERKARAQARREMERLAEDQYARLRLARHKHDPEKTASPGVVTVDYGSVVVQVFQPDKSSPYSVVISERGKKLLSVLRVDDLSAACRTAFGFLDQKQQEILQDFSAHIPGLLALYQR